MDEKLLNRGVAGRTVGPGSGFETIGLCSRAVDIPEGLSEHDLVQLSPTEIEARIKKIGPAIGYAGMIKMAAGAGDTPPNTQFHAAKFLIERTDTLDEKDRAQQGAWGLDSMTIEQLRRTSDELQRQLDSLPPPDIDARVMDAEVVAGDAEKTPV